MSGQVVLERAQGLKAMDTNGYSDPYVIVAICGFEQRSKTCQKTLEPIWEEEIVISGLTLREIISSGLNLKLWDQVHARREAATKHARALLARPMPRQQARPDPTGHHVRMRTHSHTLPGDSD